MYFLIKYDEVADKHHQYGHLTVTLSLTATCSSFMAITQTAITQVPTYKTIGKEGAACRRTGFGHSSRDQRLLSSHRDVDVVELCRDTGISCMAGELTFHCMPLSMCSKSRVGCYPKERSRNHCKLLVIMTQHLGGCIPCVYWVVAVRNSCLREREERDRKLQTEGEGGERERERERERGGGRERETKREIYFIAG
jgi:hypothetical protein